MSKRFDDNAIVQKVIKLLEHDDSQGLEGLEQSEKSTFVCFIDDVAVMQNSGLIRPELAAYTFGLYAKDCLQADSFWTNGLDQTDPFCTGFVELLRELTNIC